MSELRRNPPKELAGEVVTQVLDYNKDGTGLPRSNVLRFIMADGEAIVRPSGTEPKLKVYLTAAKETCRTSQEMIERLEGYFTLWAK